MPNCDFDIDILEEGNNKVALADFEYIYNRKNWDIVMIVWVYLQSERWDIAMIFLVYFQSEIWDIIIIMKEEWDIMIKER